MTSFFSLDAIKTISSVVGMIGGFLGLFVFIDNYVLRFKPNFNISNRLFFRYKTENKTNSIRGRTLESVILKIEAINRRNKIGRIDDFAVRIYNSTATSPSAYMLYAEHVIEKLPSKPSDFDEEDVSSFSPVSIIGRSKTSFVVEFRPEINSTVILNHEGSLKLDLLFYLKNKGWKSVGTFTPYYFKWHNEKEDSNGVIEYSLLDNSVTRGEASKSLKEPEIGIYKGISGKYIWFYLMKPVWLLKRIANYPIKVTKLIYALLVLLIRQITSYFIVFPLIKLKSKTISRYRLRPARTHLSDDTEAALKKCRVNIKKLSEKINTNADNEAKITIVDNKDGFSILRGNLEVKFYRSGDGFIRANDSGGYPQMFTFSMELVEYPFGIRLWKVNNKIMTVKSACIHVMDWFILLAQ